VSRLLLVDDEPSARQTMEALLLPEGHELHFAASGEDALLALERAPVDLVICDVMMPRVSGLDVCRAMKQHPEWRFVPVILVTALDGRDDVVRGLDAGADDFLSRPVEGAVLRARVRAMLRVRAHYREPSRQSDENTLLRERRARLISAAALTQRESEVLELLLLGRAHPDIAVALAISERTSKFHQANLLRKLGAESRNDLMRLFL
jgi:DNA-binding NarL/FixJ family response regulator